MYAAIPGLSAEPLPLTAETYSFLKTLTTLTLSVRI